MATAGRIEQLDTSLLGPLLDALPVPGQDGEAERIEGNPTVLVGLGWADDDLSVIEAVLDGALNVEHPSAQSASPHRRPHNSFRRQPVTAARAMVQARTG